MMLIDSLMINCPIPNILFAEVNREGKPVKHCVDGQQRLTSIVSFMNGLVCDICSGPQSDELNGSLYPDTLSVSPRYTLRGLYS